MKSSYLFFCMFLCATLTQAVAQKQAKTGSIADVSFVQGSWKATWGDRSVDAVWSAPGAGSIVGYVRVIRDGKVTLYEMFAFEETEQGLVVLVRHFGPGLIAREEKETPNLYKFLEAGEGWALVEQQGEDTRVRYEKRSDDEFAIVVGKPQNGEWVFKDFWVFSRVK